MYLDLFKFVAPLSITLVVTDVGQMASNAAITRLSSSNSDTIGVYTAVYFFVLLLASFTKSFNSVVLALPQTRAEFRRVMMGFAVVSVTLFTASVVIAVTPLAHIVTGMEASQSETLRTAFLSLSVLPTAVGLRYVLEGALSRKRLAMPIATASAAGFGVQVAATFLVLSIDPKTVGLSDVTLSALTIYASTLTKIAVMAFAWWRYDGAIFPVKEDDTTNAQKIPLAKLHRRSSSGGKDVDGGDVDEESVPLYPKGPTKGPVAATNAAAPEKQRQPAESNVSFKKVLAFSGPLALSELVQRVSRPVINGICALIGGTEAVAVLGLVYPLGHLSYGWINTLKNTEAAFRGTTYSPAEKRSKIQFFATVCVVLGVALGVTGVLSGFFDWILRDVQSVESGLAEKCRGPLLLFSLFAIPVGVRGVATGRLVASKNTKPALYAGPVRLVCICLFLLVLPLLGVTGGMLGVGALFSGFLSETSTIVVGMMCQAEPSQHDALEQSKPPPPNAKSRQSDAWSPKTQKGAELRGLLSTARGTATQDF